MSSVSNRVGRLSARNEVEVKHLFSIAMLAAMPLQSASSQTLLEVIPTNVDPIGVAVSSATNRAYLPGFESQTNQRIIGVVDLGTKAVSKIPLDNLLPWSDPTWLGDRVGFHLATQLLYFVAQQDSKNVLATFDEKTGAITTLPLQLGFVTGFAFNPSTGRSFLLGHDMAGQRLLEIVSGGVAAQYPLPMFFGVAATTNPSTDELYVFGADDVGQSRLIVIAGASGAVTANIPVDGDAFALAWSPSASRVYAPGLHFSGGSWAMSIIDPASGAVEYAPLSFSPRRAVANVEAGK